MLGSENRELLQTYMSGKVKSAYDQAKCPTGPALYSVLSNIKQPGVFLLSPGWDASPSQGYPSIKVSCRLVPRQAQTRTARSGGERPNHEATAPPLSMYV